MIQKDNFSETTSLMPLLVLVGLILGVGVVSNLLSLGIWELGDLSMNEVQGDNLISFGERMLLRIGLSINHLGMFLIPGCIWVYLFRKKDYPPFLKLNSFTSGHVYLWALIILCSYPLIAFLSQVNMDLPLAEWMRSSNEATLNLMEKTLFMDGIAELLMNLFLVGLLAAFGEELIFRGIIQRTFSQHWNNPHLAIWVTALIFGLFHMQFERFIPLAFLGLLLGYAYYYTDSLWSAILLHFINNGLQVLLLYSTRGEELPKVDKIPEIPIVITVLSFLLTLSLFYIATRLANMSDERRP
ncbi:MAG: membrane protease YdiL (CAAX protease family) [Saprospiraceae bacterium]